MLVEGSPAPKLLAQHLGAAQRCEGGFRLDGLPVFDRSHVQGTVVYKLTSTLQLDDGTGSINVVCPAAAATPGVELETVRKGDYVLVVGKLQARGEGLSLKAHKLLNLTHPCRAASSPAEAAAAEAALGRRMMQWNLECGRTGCASLAPVPAAGSSSTGSGLPASQQCSPLCGTSGGNRSGGIGGSPDNAPQPVPLALRLWRWDCASDCSYLCMWQLEGSRRQAGAAPQKYHGKWPFARLAGMQEPASVLFSLLNLAAHAHCLVRFRRLCGALWAQHGRQQGKLGGAGGTVALAENGVAGCAVCSNGSPGNGSACAVHAAAAEASSPYPYAWLWEGYMLLSIHAWLWSAIFHGRDTRLTERFDYLSAALLIFFNLFLSVVRVCQLRSPAALAAVSAPLLIFLAAHFRYMLLVLFDYGYHVKVCIAAGAAQSLLWLAWGAAAPQRRPGRASLLTFILLLNACMALEILDFPPLLSALDAHSLWHAATAPLVYLFYRFIHADATGWHGTAKAKHA
ncbi:hypothetical protein ABPG77_008794 [Micractinium sp. CCAP 211/92]